MTLLEEIRTDLAFESRNFYLSRNNIKDLPETKIETEENGEIVTETVTPPQTEEE